MSVPQVLATRNKLPWWTWVVGFLLLHAGSWFSSILKIDNGISAIYLPTAFGIVLINWWGPKRTLPLVFASAVISSYLWGVENWSEKIIFSIPETLAVFISWYLFTYKANGKYWLPNIPSILMFIFLGIIIPLIPELLLLQGFFVAFKFTTAEDFWFDFIRNCLAEYTSGFGISVVLLYYLTPIAERYKLTQLNYQISAKRIGLTHWQWAEVILMATALSVAVFYIDFAKYWFFYGVFSLFAAIRGGFGIAILANLYMYLVTYIVPSIYRYNDQASLDDENLVYVFLGLGLLYTFSAITGRTISDMIGIENRLIKQNKELEKANTELDRFVYSVSHDLIAPLKSILGLVHVGKNDITDSHSLQYFTRIEKSVRMMESFIDEVLDFSRSKRLHSDPKDFSLKNLVNEIINNVRFTEGFERVRFDLSGIEIETIISDQVRIKIILNNLISNAVKYQKHGVDHQTIIKVRSFLSQEFIIIEVEDNGEGISEEAMVKIFDMFYRGNEKSKGSGLGLYIAQEAARTMAAELSVQSKLNEGSTFTVKIPLNK